MKNKKTRRFKIRYIVFGLLGVMALAALVFMRFGGFGTGENVNPEEFLAYAEPVENITVPESAKIIALGEATHGNAEFQQLKLEVFKLMVKNNGVRAFALEGDYGGCEQVNRYIHGGEGTAQEAAAAIGFSIYRTEEMAELISYMRQYNESALEGEDLRFKAVVECYPEFTLPSFADLQLKRYVCPVTDAEVDKTVDVMRKQRATLVDEQGRKAADEDVLTIDFKGMKDGVAFEGGTAENFQMVVGAGRMLPEFEEAVRGMGVGETKTFKLPFPADYPEKSLAGTTADFEVTVKAIKTPVLPELNDEFAKKLGQDSVDALRAEVRKNLEREVKARLLSRTKVEVMDAVAKLAPFPAPKAMTEQEQEHLAQEAVQNLKQFGLDPKKAPKLPLDMFKPEAQKRVVLGILVHKLVQEKNLLATQEDIENLAGEIAASYEDSEAVKKEFLSDKNQVNAFGNVATETKVVEYVLSQAQTTEETVPFDGLMKK